MLPSVCEICGADVAEGMRACTGLSPCWKALYKRDTDLRDAFPGPGVTRRAADALADEVSVLIERKVVDTRSPAADALLDYRDPPTSPRADRIVELEDTVKELQAWSENAQDGIKRFLVVLAERIEREYGPLWVDHLREIGDISFDGFSESKKPLPASARTTEVLRLLRRGEEVLKAILSKEDHHPHGCAFPSNCAGPDHAHDDGVTWNADNGGSLAGRECKWCRAWRDAAEILKKLDALMNPEVSR